MARTKQTARKSIGGKAPRKTLAKVLYFFKMQNIVDLMTKFIFKTVFVLQIVYIFVDFYNFCHLEIK